MLNGVAEREGLESHCLDHDWVGPFGVAEMRSRIQKPGGHCLSAASLPAAEFDEQRRHLPNHAEGHWFWVLLPKQKDLGLWDEHRQKNQFNKMIPDTLFFYHPVLRIRIGRRIFILGFSL